MAETAITATMDRSKIVRFMVIVMVILLKWMLPAIDCESFV
jgi:hypothetical protein